MRRTKPSHFWQSVAGSLEEGETKIQAAERELQEETGLAPDGLIDCQVSNRYLIYPMWRHRYAPKVIENTEHVFRLPLSQTCPIQLDPSEHSEYAWLPAERAIRTVSSHTNRTAIEQWL